MTSQALNIANQIDSMTETEIEFLWDRIKRRRYEALLSEIDMKLEESMSSPTLSDEEAAERLAKLGLA